MVRGRDDQLCGQYRNRSTFASADAVTSSGPRGLPLRQLMVFNSWLSWSFDWSGLRLQVANTWPKKIGLNVHAMVRNGKKPENPKNLSVAATLEKANTYVFAESPFRNAKARSSTLLCSTK